MKLFIILLISLVFISPSAHAVKFGQLYCGVQGCGNDGAGGSDEGSILPSLNIGGGVSFQGGYGSVVSDDETSIEDRDFINYGAGLSLGIRWYFIALGATAEYQIWKQTTDKDDVSNTNASGTMINKAVTAALMIPGWAVLFKYYIDSEYELEMNNSSGNSQLYHTPESSYGVNIIHFLNRHMFAGITYQSITYTKYDNAGTETEFTDSQKPTFSNTGLMIGFYF